MSYPPTNPRVNQPPVSGNKGTGQMFYKTRICNKFIEGTCIKGEDCTYAHGVEDLREPPPNWEKYTRGKSIEHANYEGDVSGISDLKVPDALVEDEPVLNNVLAPVDPLPSSPPTITPAANDTDEQNKLKWKVGRKITGIYGDWIDDGYCYSSDEGDV